MIVKGNVSDYVQVGILGIATLASPTYSLSYRPTESRGKQRGQAMGEQAETSVDNPMYDDALMIGQSTSVGREVIRLTYVVGCTMAQCYDPVHRGIWEVAEAWEDIDTFAINAGRSKWNAGSIASAVAFASVSDVGCPSPKVTITVIDVESDTSVDPINDGKYQACVKQWQFFDCVRNWILARYSEVKGE